MTPEFLKIPISMELEPPEDLEIVRRMYEIQKSHLEFGIEAQKSFKRALQQALIALSFMSILLGYLLQTFVNYFLQTSIATIWHFWTLQPFGTVITFSSNLIFGIVITILIILCVGSWGYTTIVVVRGIFTIVIYYHPTYRNEAHIEQEFALDIYNPLKWYKGTIKVLYKLMKQNEEPTEANVSRASKVRKSLAFTSFIVVITFITIILMLPHCLPLP